MRMLVVAVLAYGCAKTDELETQVTALKTELAETQRRVDDLAKEIANAKYLEKKLDALLEKVDRLAAKPPAYPPRPSRPEPDRAKTYAVPLGDAPSIGPADAKVTMIVASDYACPFCEKNRGVLDELRRKYGRELRLVFEQMVIHPRNAMAAGLASCAAHKQRRFAEMDKLLWQSFQARQLDVSDVPGLAGVGTAKCWDVAAGCPIVLGHARALRLDLARFRRDMIACQQPIQEGMRVLQAFGVAATPSFFINGRFTSGAMPIDNFTALIDEELAKANARIQRGTRAADYYQKHVLDEGLTSLTP